MEQQQMPAAARAERRWVADLVMVLVAAIWGLNNVVMKGALKGWVTPVAFNAVRFPLGTAAIMVLMLWTQKDRSLPKGLWWKVALFGLLGNGLNQFLFVNGIARTTANNAGIISAMNPVLTAVVAGITGLEYATGRLWLGVVISVTGILLVTLGGAHGFSGFHAGDGLLLLAALTWAGYTVFAGPLGRQTSPLKVTAYAMLAASVPILLMGLPDLLRQDWSQVHVGSWIGLLYAGLLSNAGSYAMYVWVVQRMGSTRSSMFSNLSPLITAVGAYLFLGELWHGVQWLGAALVIAGVLLGRWDVLVASLRRRGSLADPLPSDSE